MFLHKFSIATELSSCGLCRVWLSNSDVKNQWFWCCFSSFLVVAKLNFWSFPSVALFSLKVGAREGLKGVKKGGDIVKKTAILGERTPRRALIVIDLPILVY